MISVSIAERAKQFEQAVKTEARRRTRIQRDTIAEIARLLREALDAITAQLGDNPSEYEAWRIPRLQREIERIMREFGEDAGTSATAGQERAYDAGQALIDAPLAASGVQVAHLPDRIDAGQLRAMQSFLTTKMKRMSLDASNRINSELAQVLIGSQGIEDALVRMQQIEGISRRRAITVVRTELGRAYAVAAQVRGEQASRSVPGLKKQWRRSGKRHSRPNHDRTDGQIRPIEKPFVIGFHRVTDGSEPTGTKLMHPHDPAAPPSETINCGCISLPYIDSWADTGLLVTPGPKPFES